MNRVTKSILIDAVRRQEINGDPQRTRMTVLAMPSAATQAVDLGLIKPSFPPVTPKVLAWYDLTMLGLKETDAVREEMQIAAGEQGNTERLWNAI